MLCHGCGHIELFVAMNRLFESYPEKHVFSDIGCYTLGALPPYDAISTCVDMGASITMAKGASDAGMHPAVAVIGDSTFTHSGITGLIDAVNDGVAITIIISDNATVAMTGGQESSGDGNLFDICKGVGVDVEHIRVIEPLKKNLQKNIAILREEFEYRGVSVVIAQRECVQVAIKDKKQRNKTAAAKAAA
jgi:indolepyruvate ferredoxin oxidoreductase alpha subunit